MAWWDRCGLGGIARSRAAPRIASGADWPPPRAAGKVFFAKYDEKAVWYDDLEPLDWMELPWKAEGLPRPCIDEACQIDWMDEYLN